MEKAAILRQELPEAALNAHIHKVEYLQVVLRHRLCVRELHPVNPLHGQDSPSSEAVPHDSGNPNARNLPIQLLHSRGENSGGLRV